MPTEQRELHKRYLSPNEKAFERFKKNKPAIAGFFIIVIAVLIAIFGYLLAPDSTPSANDQVLEIATSSPGFEIDMLQVRKNRPIAGSNILKKIAGGAENQFTQVPINSFILKGDSVFVDGYTGIKDRTNSAAYHLVDLVYPVNTNEPIVKTTDRFTFTDINGKKESATKSDLLQRFEKKGTKRKRYLLGTDKFGRDNLSRLILGVRVSISVGLLAALISLIIGLFFGSIAGFYQKSPPKVSIWIIPAIIIAIAILVYLFGIPNTLIRVLSLLLFPITIIGLSWLFQKMLSGVWDRKFTLPVDDMVMWFINVFWSIPLLLLVFALVLALGREFWQIYLAVGLTMWVEIARIVRGQFLSLREKEYVEAAESLGFSNFRTITKHILPNCIGPIIVITAANFATAIIIEAGLSFLGIGVQPPQPSWGTMLNEYYQYIGSNKSFLAIIPGLAIMLLVLAFNLMGNGLRDAFDVKTRL